MPEQDYRDMIALLHETGGPDGQPLLESQPEEPEGDIEVTAGPVNEFRRTHQMG